MYDDYFQNEPYIPQLFIRKFSPREPKCLNGVAVADWDGQSCEKAAREIAQLGLYHDYAQKIVAAARIPNAQNVGHHVST